MKARLYLVILSICLALGVVPSMAGAAVPSTALFVNGVKVIAAQPPVSQNGATMVSAKETIEALGLQFNWDAGNKRIIAAKDNVALTIKLGEPVGFVNGVAVFLPAPATTTNGRVMVPLRFLTDGLGASLETKNGAISIKSAGIEKSRYYSGLPLQITDTAVKNFGTEELDVSYVDFYYNNGKPYSVDNELTLAPGQKGAFDHADTRVLELVTLDDGDSYGYVGRAIKQVSSGGKVTASLGYQQAKDLYYSETYRSQLSGHLDKINAQLQQQRKQLLANNKNVPLFITDTSVSYDDYGYPEANIVLTNLTEKRIIGFELSFSCYDLYNSPVEMFYGSGNRFYGKGSNVSIESGYREGYTWDLYGYSDTAKIVNVSIDKVAYSDGTSWVRKK